MLCACAALFGYYSGAVLRCLAQHEWLGFHLSFFAAALWAFIGFERFRSIERTEALKEGK